MSDVMKVSADVIENIYEDCGSSPSAETRRLIADLRQLAKEAFSSDASDTVTGPRPRNNAPVPRRGPSKPCDVFLCRTKLAD
jgi:hypothetical protein